VLPDLELHPDVADGLRRLHRSGVRLMTLTNGATRMSEGAFARAGVLDLLEDRLPVADAGAWKPAAAPYRYAVDRAGVAADRAALVAVHPWDVDGALRAGLRGAWLSREGGRWPAYLLEPTWTAPDLGSLADAMLQP
jgi:2-haloacid dehalogenase